MMPYFVAGSYMYVHLSSGVVDWFELLFQVDNIMDLLRHILVSL